MTVTLLPDQVRLAFIQNLHCTRPHQLHPLCHPTTLLLGPSGARLSLADISRDMAHAQAIALPRVVAKKSWKGETGGAHTTST